LVLSSQFSDVRYGMELHDLTSIFSQSSVEIPVLSAAAKAHPSSPSLASPDATGSARRHSPADGKSSAVRAICVKALGAVQTRKEADALQEFAKRHAGAAQVSASAHIHAIVYTITHMPSVPSLPFFFPSSPSMCWLMTTGRVGDQS
jgi:hypothetical protein